MAEASGGDSTLVKNSTALPAQKAEVAHKFNYGDFTDLSATRLATDKDGYLTGKVETRRVEISRDLEDYYRGKLQEHVDKLYAKRDIVTSTGVRVFDTPQYEHERLLLERLSGPDGKPDQAKINAFLSTSEGFIIANQLLEERTAKEMFSIGIEELKIPTSDRGLSKAENRTIHTGLDQGRINRWWNSKTVEERKAWLRKKGIQIGVGTATAAAGLAGFVYGVDVTQAADFTLFTKIVNPLLTAGVSAGGLLAGAGMVKGGVDLFKAFRPGERFQQVQSVQALQLIKGDPVEEAYMREMYGIDVNDFVIVGDRIEANLTKNRSTKNIKELQDEIVEARNRRTEFYSALGIDSAKVDAMPEEYLLRGMGNDEELGTVWQKKINEYIEANGGLSNNRSANVKKFMEGRREFVKETLNNLAKKERNAEQKAKDETETQGKLAVIEKGIKDREAGSENSELKKKREQKHTDVINAHTEDNKKLTEQQTAIKAFKDSIDAAKKANADLQTIIDLSSVPTKDFDSLKKALAALDWDASAPRVSLTIDGQYYSFESISAANLKAKKDHHDRQAAYTGPKPDAYRQYSDSLLKDEMTAIDKQAQELQKVIKRLQEIKDQADVKQNAMTSSNEEAKKAQDALKGLQDRYSQFIEIDNILITNGKSAVGIDIALLQNGDLDEIFKKVNDAYKATKNQSYEVGWPKEENMHHREELEHAIIEAKARAHNSFVAPGVEFSAITNKATWNFSEQELLTLNEEQIFAEMQKRNAVLKLGPIFKGTMIPVIKRSREVAQERFQARMQSFKDRIQEKEKIILRENTEKGKINYESELDILKVGRDLISRQESIFSAVHSSFKGDPKFIDTTKVSKTKSADTNYSPAEKAAAYPKGYYEIINMLFSYQADATKNRDEEFKRISKVLPPKALARRLHDSLNLAPDLAAITPPITLTGTNADLDVVFSVLSTKLPKMSKTELRKPFKDLINEYRDKAAAIAS